MKKRYALLLEALITLLLFTLLCSALFSAYHQITIQQRQNKIFLDQCLDQDRLECSLKKLFNHILTSDSTQKDKKFQERFYFFTQDPIPGETIGKSLVFTFDNQLDKLEEFSSSQIAHLFLDTNHQLKLVFWPSLWNRNSNLYREEILFTDVESLEFSFYNPPDNKEITLNKPKSGQNDFWLNQYKELPAIVKIKILTLNRQSFEYNFHLSQSLKTPNFAKERFKQ